MIAVNSLYSSGIIQIKFKFIDQRKKSSNKKGFLLIPYKLI